MLASVIAAQALSLYLPANTAYLLGPKNAEIADSGRIVGWTRSDTAILWGGYIATPGTLRVLLDTDGSDGRTTFRLTVSGKQNHEYKTTGSTLAFTNVELPTAGWYKFQVTAYGGAFGTVKGLELQGSPTRDARFNLKSRRNAASVHIGYPEANGKDVEWFYNEVKATEQPLYTYYMACGFKRGYFGMQINSPSERRIIFSVWDSGNEAVDRSRVNDENRVKLLAKGENVVADSFGNEGTGGHSHEIYNWRTNSTQKFLVHAVKDGNATIYTGYHFRPELNRWSLIASFRAPKDGQLMRGLYSFIEDFGGEFGDRLRAAEFGPTWIRTTDGQWMRMTTGRFTHDVTGGKDRFDYDLTAINDGFRLQNGGFRGNSPTLGTLVTTIARSEPPNIDFSKLRR